ncbi:MAG: hypothetical protein NT116_01475, partial [Candidatus Parcubacteria bacterium]|nr:hypothetical protein [Candidatus Parcubacteria bacterium]
LEESKEKEEANTKLFSNLLAGELRAGDYLFLSNAGFLDIVSLERIQKTITSLPIHKAAEYFKNSLLQHEGHNFAAIIIKNSLAETNLDSLPQSLSSITELNLTETSTERLLEPSFWIHLKALPAYLFKHFKKSNKPKLEKTEDITSENENDPQKPAKPLSPLNNLFSNIAYKIKKVFKNLQTRSPWLSEKFQKVKNYFRLKLAYLGNYLKKIPNLNKILLIIALLLLILFIYSTSYSKHLQLLDANDEEFQKIIAQIEDKKNQAESDLIYGDEAKARQEIADAQNLLGSLIVKSQKQKDKQQEINNGIELVIAKLRHITKINEPVLISDLSTQQENNINITNLIFQNNQLLAFDSINNTIYSINLENREVKKSLSNLSDIGSIEKAHNIDNVILAYHNKNGFVEFKDSRLSPLSVILPPNAKIIDFASYNGRLYTFDQTGKQIYRHPKVDSGYGAGVNWLKNTDFDFNNIVSLAIDNNIWLLDQTGAILKFNKGRTQNFVINNLEPKLEAPTQLLTSDETNYLYIIEPKNKRIVVLDKKGELITQYYSDTFDNLKGFEIVEKEKKIFVINDNKIFFFNLEHIK